MVKRFVQYLLHLPAYLRSYEVNNVNFKYRFVYHC
jgi:hypothetical protein